MIHISRKELLQDLKQAIDLKRGFAMGKLGFSEQFLLGYLPFLQDSPTPIQTKSYEAVLKYHCEIQFGVFPTMPEFMREFAAFYTDCAKSMSILGLFEVAQEKELLAKNHIQAKFIPYQETEPDRSIPGDAKNCYLPFLKNKKLLFISPYANLLKERTNKEIFEGVWSNINKKWFYPGQVSSIEIPYSYGNSVSTHQRYGSSINLFKSICSDIDNQDFDIALMGVGALGIPLASYIKKKGKVAISLGGHLQVLFGIKGSRWNGDNFWNTHYFNDSWIEMPRQYHPEQKEKLTDKGAYW